MLVVVALAACDPAPQSTLVPGQTETPAATQTPLTSSPTQTPTAPAVTQTPTSENTPTPAPLPDLVIAIEVRLKSNPSIEWGDGCVVSSSASLPFHVGELTARVRNVGWVEGRGICNHGGLHESSQ